MITQTSTRTMGKSYLAVGVLACLLFSPHAFGQFSGFLEEYPPLSPLENVPALVWKAPDVDKKYRAILYDTPEIFLDPESEYKGIQPDAIKALSDTLREILETNAAKRGLEVVDEPGPQVLRVRSALTNVYLKRRSRSARFRYPTSYSAFQLRAAIGRDVSLVEATLEYEALDSETDLRLGVVIAQEGQREVEELDVRESSASWSELASIMRRLGAAASNYFADLVDEER